MPDILSALQIDGQPEESGWPYLDQLPAEISRYKPPANVGTVYRRDTTEKSSLSAILALLGEQRAPLIAMEISQEFFYAQAGQVLRAPISSPTVNRHGVVVVGAGEEQNESVFLVRNSWGAGWADGGHAWISRGYLQPRLISVGVMEI